MSKYENDVIMNQLTDEIAQHAKTAARKIILESLLAERDKEIQRLEIALHTHKSYDQTASELHAEVQQLKQRLADFEGCKGVEDYYAILCKSREQQQEIQRLSARIAELEDAKGDDFDRDPLSHQTEQPDTQTVKHEFPRHEPNLSGWVINTDYLEQVVQNIEDNHGDDVVDYTPSWEDIELVLLAVERMSQPAPKGEEDRGQNRKDGRDGASHL